VRRSASYHCLLPLPCTTASYHWPSLLPRITASYHCLVPLPHTSASYHCPSLLPRITASYHCLIPVPPTTASHLCLLPLTRISAPYHCLIPVPPTTASYHCLLPLSPVHCPAPLPHVSQCCSTVSQHWTCTAVSYTHMQRLGFTICVSNWSTSCYLCASNTFDQSWIKDIHCNVKMITSFKDSESSFFTLQMFVFRNSFNSFSNSEINELIMSNMWQYILLHSSHCLNLCKSLYDYSLL